MLRFLPTKTFWIKPEFILNNPTDSENQNSDEDYSINPETFGLETKPKTNNFNFAKLSLYELHEQLESSC